MSWKVYEPAVAEKKVRPAVTISLAFCGRAGGEKRRRLKIMVRPENIAGGLAWWKRGAKVSLLDWWLWNQVPVTLGNLVGGFGGDWLPRKTSAPILSCKIIVIVGLVVSACSLAAVNSVTTVNGALVLLSTARFFESMVPVNCWLLVQELVPQSRTGAVGGYMHMLSNTSGIIGPAATGFMIQYTGAYGLSFLVAGGLVIAGALAVLLFVRTPRAAASRRATDREAE